MRIARLIIYEAISSFVVLLIVSLVVFLCSRALGDPLAQLVQDPFVDPSTIEELRKLFGLDKPLPIQFAMYMLNLFRGELGYSTLFNKPVSSLIAERLPYTLLLLVPSVTASNMIAYRLGLEAGWRRGSALDRVLTMLFVVARSIPYIVMAIAILILFAYAGFPTYGAWTPGEEKDLAGRAIDILVHYIPPFTALTLKTGLGYGLYVRQLVVSTRSKDFVFVAEAMGIPPKVVKHRYVARYALPSIIAVLGLRYAFVVEGAVITETIFSYPGMGTLLVEAIRSCDVWLIQGVATVLTLCVIATVVIVDVVQRILDPRIGGSR